MLNAIETDKYRVLLKETKNYNVIKDVESGLCDIGILAIKNSDYDIMNRFLQNIKVEFNFIKKHCRMFL